METENINSNHYFYRFMEQISYDLARLSKELEQSIFVSPRTMLNHSRVFIENILQLVSEAEGFSFEHWIGLKERIDMLDEKGLLTEEIRAVLHDVRMLGNQASHDSRMFRISEALRTWENIHMIVKWYVEVYGPVDMNVPSYVDPTPPRENTFDSSELQKRIEEVEKLLRLSLEGKRNDGQPSIMQQSVEQPETSTDDRPGFTTIRTIHYKEHSLAVPHFLRDAFLLPQRFDKSERFLIQLGAAQEARIMSELPDDLEGLHTHVKRYNEQNDENFFHELKTYIEEEKERRSLQMTRPGELFFFYKADYIVLTDGLANRPITTEQFTGFPSLIKQLNEKGFHTVGQLPKELITLAKYKSVGKGTVEKLFEQLGSE